MFVGMIGIEVSVAGAADVFVGRTGVNVFVAGTAGVFVGTTGVDVFVDGAADVFVGRTGVNVFVGGGRGVVVGIGIDVFVMEGTGEFVRVGTIVGVLVGTVVGLRVKVGVRVLVGTRVGVLEGVAVLVLVGRDVGVLVEVDRSLGRRVRVGPTGVKDAVTVGVWDGSRVGVNVDVVGEIKVSVIIVDVGVGTKAVTACSVRAATVFRFEIAKSIMFTGSRVTFNGLFRSCVATADTLHSRTIPIAAAVRTLSGPAYSLALAFTIDLSAAATERLFEAPEFNK